MPRGRRSSSLCAGSSSSRVASIKIFNLNGDEWDRAEDRPGWRSKDAWVGARIESESENTVMHLSEEDVYDLDGSSVPGGEGDELAIGSQRGAPPVYAKGSDIQTYDDTMDEDTADSAPKFKDVDTIVSQYTPRKA